MKLLLQIGVAPDQAIEGFLLPNVCIRYLRGFVDAVRGGGLDALEDLAQRSENRFALLIVPFDLRLEKQVNVVGHHTGSEELVLVVMVGWMPSAIAKLRVRIWSAMTRKATSVDC